MYEYSLKQGIEDGFLAPYRVHRVITTFDAAGWRPTRGQLDRYGSEIPDEEYHTKDFERLVSLKARTEAVAQHLTDYLKRSDRFAKTIVFCVDQEHADEMRRALSNLNADLVAQNPNYVCRVTAAEGDIGPGHLSRLQDLETNQSTPTILTSSQMLTTGVDAPTVKNVVLVRVIGSMSEFKQIIGRGTRVPTWLFRGHYVYPLGARIQNDMASRLRHLGVRADSKFVVRMNAVARKARHYLRVGGKSVQLPYATVGPLASRCATSVMLLNT